MIDLIAKLELPIVIAACAVSIFVTVNSHFRNVLFRKYVKRGARFSAASARVSALWFGALAIFLILDVSHNRSQKLLMPMAMCLLVAALFITLVEYRRYTRSH